MLRSLCAVLILRASAATDQPARSAVRLTVDGVQHRSLLSLLGGSVADDAAKLSDVPSASIDRAERFSTVEARYRTLSGGLDPMVDVSLLAQQVCDGLYEGVSDREVDELMAETAAYQASMHPDFARLAARVAASRLHAQTEPSLVATFRALHAHKDPFSGGPAPLISAELLTLAEELAPLVEPALRHERDFDFDYFGLRTLQRSYLLGDEGGARERPQHMLMRVALCVHGRDAPAVLQACRRMLCARAAKVNALLYLAYHTLHVPCMYLTWHIHTLLVACTLHAHTLHVPCMYLTLHVPYLACTRRMS